MPKSLTIEGGKVEQIFKDFAKILDWDNDDNKGMERAQAIRFRIACNDGTSYVASGYQDEYKWDEKVEFRLELSPLVSEGGVNVYIKKTDIESGAVRVDVFI